jgi:hypothetical protein
MFVNSPLLCSQKPEKTAAISFVCGRNTWGCVHVCVCVCVRVRACVCERERDRMRRDGCTVSCQLLIGGVASQ